MLRRFAWRRLRPAFTAMVATAFLASACSSNSAANDPARITVDPAAAESDSGAEAVTVGIVLNTASPTAARDERLVDVLAASAEAVSASQAVEIIIETVSISDVGDAPSAVNELVNRGVTVVATSCDDSSMPTVVEAAVEQQLLAVTGCVAIPKPELTVSNQLFIDLASLDDSAAAIVGWAESQEFDSLAVLSSELIPDVEQTCVDIEKTASTTSPGISAGATGGDSRGVEIAATGSFVELVDDPEVLVASLASQLPDVDAIVVCALAPALGDVIAALRNAGIEQPVLVPWFGEPQTWDSFGDVFVFSPSSVAGDDPSSSVDALFGEINDAEAVDVVAADTLAAIAQAASTSNSVGSTRLARAIRTIEIDGLSGDVVVGSRGQLPVTRDYRVLEVSDGEVSYLERARG